jgi:hypothetical protein
MNYHKRLSAMCTLLTGTLIESAKMDILYLVCKEHVCGQQYRNNLSQGLIEKCHKRVSSYV